MAASTSRDSTEVHERESVRSVETVQSQKKDEVLRYESRVRESHIRLTPSRQDLGAFQIFV